MTPTPLLARAFLLGMFAVVLSVPALAPTPADAAAAIPCVAPVVCPAGAATPCGPPFPCPPVFSRYFPQTGYVIDRDAFWDYFQRRGGLPTFGYPVSRTVQFQGYPTQFFQRQVMQLWPDGTVHLLNLLDPGYMPYQTFNFSIFPAEDAQLVAQAPHPGDPNYGAEAIAFVRAHAPDEWQGMPVRFARTYFGTVSPQAAFPNQSASSPAVQSLLPVVQLEVWGLPTSAPAFDPANHGFVYLRWQRGVMLYDASCDCTQGILFADYLKSILMDQRLPVDLAQEAATGTFFAQYAPGQPNWVARPAELPNTNLTDAFTQQPPPPVPLASCGSIVIGGVQRAPLDPSAASTAETCCAHAYQQCVAATLQVTWMGVDAGVVRHFAVSPSGGQCSITDQAQSYVAPRPPLPATTYACASVAQKPEGLIIAGCGADGDVLVPA